MKRNWWRGERKKIFESDGEREKETTLRKKAGEEMEIKRMEKR